MPGPSEEQIRARAHQIWIAEGYPEGRDFDHWLMAIAQLEVTPPPAKPARKSAVKTDAVAGAERATLKPAKAAAKPAPKKAAPAKTSKPKAAKVETAPVDATLKAAPKRAPKAKVDASKAASEAPPAGEKAKPAT